MKQALVEQCCAHDPDKRPRAEHVEALLKAMILGVAEPDNDGIELQSTPL